MFETLFSRPPAIQRHRVIAPAPSPLSALRTSRRLQVKEHHAPQCAYGRTTACGLPGRLRTGRGTIVSPQPRSTPWPLPGPLRAWPEGGHPRRKIHSSYFGSRPLRFSVPSVAYAWNQYQARGAMRVTLKPSSKSSARTDGSRQRPVAAGAGRGAPIRYGTPPPSICFGQGSILTRYGLGWVMSRWRPPTGTLKSIWK